MNEHDSSVDQQQPLSPNPIPNRKAHPRKLRVNPSRQAETHTANDHAVWRESDGVSKTPSRTPSSTQSRSPSRAQGGRKNRSKLPTVSESREHGDMQKCREYPDRYSDNDAASSGASSGTSTPHSSRPRKLGGRKEKSKRQIASENQRVTDGQAQPECEQDEQQQLRKAERELYGPEYLSTDDTHSDSAADYYPSDSSRPGEGCGDDDGREHGGQGLQVRDQVRQERQDDRKPPPRRRRQPRQQPETGVGAFRARRVDPGARPGGVKVARKSDNRRQSHHSHSETDRQYDDQEKRSPRGRRRQGKEQEQEQIGGSPNEGKEAVIKFDLNMEVEILLKAKIKGEIIVTFM